jgi:ankyrin repeat protein
MLIYRCGANVNLVDNDGNSPLIETCIRNNIEIVENLLAFKADVNMPNKYGITPLLISCDKNNIDIFKLLLKYKADVNVSDKNGNTPLIFACAKNNIEIVKLLLELKVDVNVSDKDGNTPLILACSNGNLEIVKLLLELKADVNVSNKDGNTPLIFACYKNNIEIVKLLLELKADVNVSDKNGNTPLLEACAKNNIEIVKLLLELKADVNVSDKKGFTPLIFACYKNNTDIIKLLLKLKVDVNVSNKDGITPLRIACIMNNIEIVKLLLELKADVNVSDRYGYTPLLLACKKNNIEIFKLLIAHKADINLLNKITTDDVHSNNIQMIWNFLISYPEIFILYIDNQKLFIDNFDREGKNLLMNAIQIGNIDIIQKILDKDININAVDSNGDTALHYALRKNDEIIITLLCSHPKIVPFIPNKDGRTAINLSNGTEYALIVRNTSGISFQELQNQKWKGVTKEYLENIFNSIYLDKAHSDDNIFRSKNNTTPCPACLIPVERKDACNHIQHMCLEEFSKDIYTGGIVPYWNNHLRTIPDHGFEMQTKNICHMCCICGTTYGGMTDRPPMEYPIRFRPGTEAKITHSYWACPYGFQLKYYRIYKIIQKIQEIQPRDGTVSHLTYAQAMEQITLAGANVIFDRIPAGDLDRVITDIKTRKTFLPLDISMFPNIDMKVLYPPIGKIKRIPNMRKMRDVIANILMPEIITYPEIKNDDGTSKDPKEFKSPVDPIDYDTHENFIKFKHREFTIDNNYQIKQHDSLSLESFMASFNSTISQMDQENFGKCVLFPFEIIDGKCKSYLYPEELGILINEGYIDHATYIKYRDIFHNSDLIQIEHSVDAKKYFIPDTIARAGGSLRDFNILDDKFKTKYLKYKQKYIELKNQIGGNQV